MPDPDKTPEKPKPKSLFFQDLDRITDLVKRSATLGAVLGYLHHLHCLAN